MKSLIVLENDGWFWTGFEEFLKTIAPEHQVFRPEVNDLWYLKNTSLWLAMTLSHHAVTDVAMQTAFELGAAHNPEADIDDEPRQIEVLIPVIRDVLRFRKQAGLSPLTFHVVYNGGNNFMGDVEKGRLGEKTREQLSLILRQQNNITIKLYNDKHELLQIVKGSAE